MRLNTFPCSSRLLPSFFNPPNVATITSNLIPNRVPNQRLAKNLNPHSEFLQICLQHWRRIQAHNLFDEKPKPVLQALRTTKVIHSKSLKLGVGLKGLLGNVIVDLYVKCGNVDFAQKAFSKLEKKDVFAWNSVISMYSNHGLFATVVQSFVCMWNHGVRPNEFTFAMVLSACSGLQDINFGRQVYCGVLKIGFRFRSFCQGGLIDMYAKCRNLRDARLVFDGALNLDTVSWTVLIAGYVRDGFPMEAVKRFGRHVCQIRGFKRCKKQFELMKIHDNVSWNAIIVGYVQEEYNDESFFMFRRMVSNGVLRDEVSFASIVSACANVQEFKRGQQCHCLLVKVGLDTSTCAGSSLIDMYVKCGVVLAARDVFYSMSSINVVSINALIAGYTMSHLEEAIHLSRDPDGWT